MLALHHKGINLHDITVPVVWSDLTIKSMNQQEEKRAKCQFYGDADREAEGEGAEGG